MKIYIVKCFPQRKKVLATLSNPTIQTLHFAHPGKVYAIGGSDGQTVLDTVECYNTETEEWTPVASMATPRVNIGVGVVDGKIYAVGGFSGKEFLSSVEVYDPMTNRWYQFARHLRAPVTASPPLSPVISSMTFAGTDNQSAKQRHSNGNNATTEPHTNGNGATPLPVA